MLPATIVILKTEPHYLPLYWTHWNLTWGGGLGSAKAVCHLLMPDNAAHREQLFAVYRRAAPVPCVLKDPVLATWYCFDAYLTMDDLRADLEVTLIADGAVREGVQLPPRPRTRRRTRATRPKLQAPPADMY